jgi:3-oxoacyl-[acyl-carrier protein] reductase
MTDSAGALIGHVAAVTGAGSGLGLLTAERLLAQGAQVVANHRSSDESLRAVEARHPGALHLVAGDIGDESTAEAIADCARRLGRLDAFVHNAAISRDRGLIAMSVEEWDAVMRVNLRGAFLATKHALQVMLPRRYGRMIYVSSLAAVIGNAGQANYAASKAGLHGLSHAVAQEYSSRGIRSVVLAPGLLDTGMGARLTPKIQRRKVDRTLHGIGDGRSIAATIAFLAGHDADFINGAVVRSDGGIAF